MDHKHHFREGKKAEIRIFNTCIFCTVKTKKKENKCFTCCVLVASGTVLYRCAFSVAEFHY